MKGKQNLSMLIFELDKEVTVMKFNISDMYNKSGLVTAEVKPVYEYVDGKRTDKEIGKVITISPLNELATLTSGTIRVKLPLDNVSPLKPNDIVEFRNLAVTPYLPDKARSIQYSFSAEGIEVVGTLDLDALIEGGGK